MLDVIDLVSFEPGYILDHELDEEDALETGRFYIGFETDERYYRLANERVEMAARA